MYISPLKTCHCKSAIQYREKTQFCFTILYQKVYDSEMNGMIFHLNFQIHVTKFHIRKISFSHTYPAHLPYLPCLPPLPTLPTSPYLPCPPPLPTLPTSPTYPAHRPYIPCPLPLPTCTLSTAPKQGCVYVYMKI